MASLAISYTCERARLRKDRALVGKGECTHGTPLWGQSTRRWPRGLYPLKTRSSSGKARYIERQKEHQCPPCRRAMLTAVIATSSPGGWGSIASGFKRVVRASYSYNSREGTTPQRVAENASRRRRGKVKQ